jgi:carbon-monoxide dehydrogenase small subunit
MIVIGVTVNGEGKTWEISPDEFLSETLQRQGYISVKTGCSGGSCGLCTVWIDDRPMLSCTTLSARMDGKKITTLEGLQKEAKEIADFLVDEGADQCGFCSPGFIMLALAIRRELKSLDDESVRAYFNGNLCRCSGYYGRLRALRRYVLNKPEHLPD